MKRIVTVLMLAMFSLLFSCQQPTLLSVSQTALSFENSGGNQSVTLTANKVWTASSNQGWLRVSPSSGEGNATLSISGDGNTTYDTRTGTITIVSEELTQIITVTQAEGKGLILSQTEYNLTNEAQTIDVTVQANVQYTVTIDDACKKWIKQESTKGLSSSTIKFAISKNEEYDGREGKITIKQTDGSLSGTVVVKQSQTNGLFVSTPEYSLSNEKHTLTVEVKSNIEFEVKPEVDWIRHIGTKGLKASQITLEVAANDNYDSREGTVSVKQKDGGLTGTITIKQDAKLGLLLSETNFELTNDSQNISFEVKYNVPFDVVIPEDCKSWITQISTKGLESKYLTFSIAKNDTYDNREGSITIKQKNGSLSGTVAIRQAQTNGLIAEKSEYEVSDKEQSLDIKVKSNIEYEVQIDDSCKEWINRVQTKGLTESTVSLMIAENSSYESRIGIIILQRDELEERIIICQKGKVPTFGTTADIVDLGLSVKWSSWNLGASAPQEYGGYYGMGDPTGDLTSTNDEDYYYVYHTSISGTEYDIAHVQWKDLWRLPTVAELEELRDKCSWQHDQYVEGVRGSIATGPNGNSIFIPYAGVRSGASMLFVGGHASIWSGFAGSEQYSRGYMDMDIYSSGYFYMNGAEVSLGQTVRPVYGELPVPTPAPAPEIVDLGLSVKWADCNVGATSPENYGYYFSWAETQNKEDYSYSTYKFYTGEGFSKYNGIDNKTELDLEDDAAYTAWGGNWRTPSEAEWVELMTECSWEWTTVNGVYGYRITSKKDGFKGNNIFLPATGFYSGTYFYQQSTIYSGVAYGTYLTSSLSTEFSFSDEFYRIEKGWGRTDGHTVRAVYAPRTSSTPEIVDLGLSVKWADCNVGATSPEKYGYYFAWAETQNKDDYSYSSYKYYTGDGFSKYNGIDNKTELDLEDDAAYAAFGDYWRTPTEAEWVELATECTWVWTTVNDVYGYRITSNKEGFKGNSIFLPATGYYSGTYFYQLGVYPGVSYGTYLTTSLSTEFSFSDEFYRIERGWTRTDGHTVRPVWRKK